MATVLDPVLLGCLQTLVGLSQTPCPCYEALPQNEAKQKLITDSESGLYIDEAEGFNAQLLLRGSTCKPGSMWDKLLRARDLAINDIVQQVAVNMMELFKPSINRNLLIGEQTYDGPIPSSVPDGVLSSIWRSSFLPGAVMTLTGLGFLGRVVGSPSVAPIVEIHVRRYGETVDLGVYTLSVLSNDRYQGQPDSDVYGLPKDLHLPCDGSVYEIYYTYDRTRFIPFNNKLRCVICTSNSEFNRFFSGMPTGSAYGVIWNVNFSCNMQYLTCALLENQAMKMTIADMIQFKTIERWLTNIISDQSMGTTSQTVTGFNQLPTIRDSFGSMYSSRLDTLLRTADLYDTELGCFVCRGDVRAARVGNYMGDHSPLSYDGWERVGDVEMNTVIPPLPQ